MITNKQNQEALTQYIEMATELLRQYKSSSNLHQLQDSSVFALGAQLMHVGQCLTQISGYKLEPPTVESRKTLSEIVRYLEMPTIEPKK